MTNLPEFSSARSTRAEIEEFFTRPLPLGFRYKFFQVGNAPWVTVTISKDGMVTVELSKDDKLVPSLRGRFYVTRETTDRRNGDRAKMILESVTENGVTRVVPRVGIASAAWTYTIFTSGPVIEKKFASLDEAKRYVEQYAPLKRGWTGQWSDVPVSSEQPPTYLYVRYNSKGNSLPNSYNVLLVKGVSK